MWHAHPLAEAKINAYGRQNSHMHRSMKIIDKMCHDDAAATALSGHLVHGRTYLCYLYLF